jgi:hypothetical protein
MQSWMFLSSYEDLREYVIEQKMLESMAHLGAHAFSEITGEVVQTTTFVIRNTHMAGFKPTFVRAVAGDEAEKSRVLREGENRFNNVKQTDFEKIPGNPLAYWLSDSMRDTFVDRPSLGDISQTRVGMATGNNAKFVRNWFEVSHSKIGFGYSRSSALQSKLKWFPYSNGGEPRRWFGNNDFIVDWEDDGRVLQTEKHETGRIRAHNFNLDKIFVGGITWSLINSGFAGIRMMPDGFLFSSGAPSLFCSHMYTPAILGFLNSNLVFYLRKAINPTLNNNSGDADKLPFSLDDEQRDEVENIVEDLIRISRTDWDLFETSWDFARSPLLGGDSLEEAFGRWESETQERRERLRELETENNRLFIAAYGLEAELSPDVPDEQITLTRSDREDDIKRLVSYAIGCLMGRYSLDEAGLIFAGAGGEGFDPARYQTLCADADGILPVTDALWFDDDLVGRVSEFLRAAYGPENFTQNLDFLAQSLRSKAGEVPEETLRRYLVSDFYRDHLRTYRNRPIYWLFSSGKEKAFGALVYLHRMNGGTLSRMRSEYVLPLLGRYGARIEQLAIDITETAGTTRRAAEKELLKRRKQLLELQAFDERLRHRADEAWSLDLDNGVKVNYGKFADLLAEVKLVAGSAE